MVEVSLENPPHSEYNGIHISICPKKYYPDDFVAHTVTLPDCKSFPYYMMALYLIFLFGAQHLNKCTPVPM